MLFLPCVDIEAAVLRQVLADYMAMKLDLTAHVHTASLHVQQCSQTDLLHLKCLDWCIRDSHVHKMECRIVNQHKFTKLTCSIGWVHDKAT